jgi:hypothetical protein
VGSTQLLLASSDQTAWAMLHRYRSVMVRPGRERLAGEVEVDESYIGGPEPGIPGRGTLGKVLFAAAVERETPRGFGRVRVAVIEDASAPSLRQFLIDNVEPGSRVITDGWPSCPPATEGLYTLDANNVSESGRKAYELLPGTHLVFSLVKLGARHAAGARSRPSTCRRTSTSGCSASTGGAPAAEGCCSTA